MNNEQSLHTSSRAAGCDQSFAWRAVPCFHRNLDGSFWLREGQSPGMFFAINRLNTRLMRTCRSLKATCIDLAKNLSFEPSDFYDHMHTTPSGAQKIDAFLFHRLKNKMDD
jgi:hypothetical protein